MATYPIKMLKDEENKPFVPLVSTDCIRDENNQTLQQILDKKLSPTNLLAGDYVSITAEGNNCYINVDLPANLNIINNLTTASAGQGALDAYQGKVLKDSIPQVVNDLSSTSTTSALSANQGYILNNKINSLVVNTLDSLSTTNALSAAQGKILNNSINELQTDINNIKTQITHDFMVLGFSGGESTWTEDAVWVPVGFRTVKSSSGSKLINSMPNVKIGAGVSKVRVFVQLAYYQGSTEDYMFLAITKNGTSQAKSIQTMAKWGQITVDYVLSVKEGDLIGAQVYKDNNGTRVELQDFVAFTNAPCNYLLVEVIE